MSALTLRQWRLAREISQEEMAKQLDVHVNTYRLWEKNPGKISIDATVKICRILELSPDDIIFSSKNLQNVEEG